MSALLIHGADLQAVALAWVAIAIAAYAMRWYTDPLRAIPTVGGSSFLPGLSYLVAWYSPPDLKEILQEGYKRYPDSAFKVAGILDQWVVIVSGRRMVEHLRRRPEEELSAASGQAELLQSQYSFEPPVLNDQYHIQILKEKLTRSFPEILPRVVDEVAVAVKEHFALAENEWTSIRLVPALRRTVAQVSSRAFVGLPLCRNHGYLTCARNFASDVVKDSKVFHRFPGFMKPLVSLLVHNARNHTNLAVPHVLPIIEERMKASAELGEGWNDKPNDMLQFLLDKATPLGESPTITVQRLLTLNFAAITTSVNTASYVLYHLAEDPKLLAPLREEIEGSIAADGWTTTALGNMWKLDSILREALRYYPVTRLTMYRKAMKDITLYDGTRIPRGTIMTFAASPMHHDEALLENAKSFDPFRYARMRSSGADESLKYQFTSTSPEYIPFGHGPHACPGRYFASYELKAILAHIILEYDLKLDGDGVRPADLLLGTHVPPASDGRILFRKRGASSPS